MYATNNVSAAPTRGVILLLALVFLAVFSTISTALLSYLVDFSKSSQHTVETSQALALAEAGVDKAAYELNQNSNYTGETTALGAGTYVTSVTTIDGNTKRVTVTGYVPTVAAPTAVKALKVIIGINPSTASFHYGIQSGNGGFTLNNSSSVMGNVYSSGTIVGASSIQNVISGDVISAGPSGNLYGVSVLGSVFAHTLGNASQSTVVQGDAYYATKTNTTVVGISHPGSPDQNILPLPIGDGQISDWETDAAAGGTVTCSGGTYTINSDVTLGPKKIPCDLNVVGSGGGITLTLAGHVWVTGNITFSNKVTVKVDASLGNKNVVFVADNPANTNGSGVISIGQSVAFQGNGNAGSYVFLISQNNSAEIGGTNAAIAMNQGASAVVAYASHGLITVNQSADVKEVTAYKIAMYQSAIVNYESGLANQVFQSGPGASWEFTPGSYAITR